MTGNRGISELKAPAVNPKSAELHRHARLLLSDAVALGERATPGQFLLFRHAIELALKSFLHRRGDSLKNLRLQFGADLDGLHRRAHDHGLAPEAPDTRMVVSALDGYTTLAMIRHNFSGNAPSLADLCRVASSLIEASRS